MDWCEHEHEHKHEHKPKHEPRRRCVTEGPELRVLLSKDGRSHEYHWISECFGRK